jgi:hypothetical protein
MAGVDLSSGSWIVAGWAFRHAIRHIWDSLPAGFALKDDLPRIEATQWLDLASLDPKELQIFKRAALSAYAHVQDEGPESFKDPGYYPDFLQKFRELLALVESASNATGQ